MIDKSGSMSGDRLALVKETVSFVIDNLQATDRLSLVTFDDKVSLHFPMAAMTSEGKERAQASNRAIVVGGSTNLCGGLVYDQIPFSCVCVCVWLT